MNSFTAVDVFYLRSNRTIETILLRNKRMRKTLFVYNYQGLTYRIFETEVQLRNFFEKNFEPNIYFEDENQLENYLIDLKLD